MAQAGRLAEAAHAMTASLFMARDLSQRSLLLFAALGLFVLFALRELHVGSAQHAVSSVTQLAIFAWGAFGVVLWRLGRTRYRAAAGTFDCWIVAAVALACIPLAGESTLAGVGVAVGAVGLHAILRSGSDPDLRAAGICMLALCGNFTIAPVFFRLFYDHIIWIDMGLLRAAIDLVGAPITATPGGLVAPDGARVLLVGGCSSFNGLSSAMLVHVAWAMAVRAEVGWRDVIAICATVLLATVVNLTRLTLTASGHDGYAFWHGAEGESPLGGQIIWFAHNAILLAGGYLSATWAAKRSAS